MRIRSLFWLAAVVGALSFVSSGSGGSSTRPGSGLPWVVDRSVNALAVADGRLFVGGDFKRVATPTGPLVAFSRSGVRDASFPAVNTGGAIRTAIADGAGGIYVGGGFTTVGGVRCARLAHVLPDGSIDRAFCPRPSGDVDSLALGGTRLYVGGQFRRIGGVARSGLAALDARTGAPTSWKPTLPSYGYSQITPTATAVWVADYYGIYALDPVTGRRLPFDPRVVITSPHADGVNGFAVAGGRVYAWGGFDGIGGKPYGNVAVLDVRTGNALPWTSPSGGWVRAGTLDGDVLYLAGDFQRFGEDRRSGIAAFDATTGLLLPWKPTGAQVNAEKALETWEGVLYGISATSYDGPEVIFARSLTTGAPVPLPLPRFNGSVDAIAPTGGRLVVGGAFRSLAGISRSDLLAVDAATGRLLPWQSGISDASVEELASVGTSLYLAGFFDVSVSGRTRNDFAAFGTRTLRLLSWNPDGFYIAGFAANRTGVYTATNPIGEEKIFQFDPHTGALRGTLSMPEGTDVLAASDEMLFDASWMKGYGNDTLVALRTSPLRVAARIRLHVDGIPVSVSLAAAGRAVYMGGAFSKLLGARQHYLARLRVDGSVIRVDQWQPRLPGPVYGVALAGEDVVVAGGTPDESRYYAALVDRATAKATVVGYWPSDGTRWNLAVAAFAHNVYVGGDFGLRWFHVGR